MELKYKTQKIRDFIAYQFNILPVRVDIDRHDVFIEIKDIDLQRADIKSSDIEIVVASLIDRRVTVHLI